MNEEASGIDIEAQVSTFNCACCCDDLTSVPINIRSSNVCATCFATGILPQFRMALKDETKYPVKWAGAELDPNDYGPHVPEHLLQQWNVMIREYKTPVQDRLYCSGSFVPPRDEAVADDQYAYGTPATAAIASSFESIRPIQQCNKFLGSRPILRNSTKAPSVLVVKGLPLHTSIDKFARQMRRIWESLVAFRLLRADTTIAIELAFTDDNQAQQLLASYSALTSSTGLTLRAYEAELVSTLRQSRIVHCDHCYCRICSECSKPLDRHGLHQCSLNTDDPFKGLSRGKDYQICPEKSCQVKIALRDGCNFLRCKICRTGFCFICGTEVEHSDDHWKVGSPCPRWGLPGSGRAIHDTEEYLARLRQRDNLPDIQGNQQRDARLAAEEWERQRQQLVEVRRQQAARAAEAERERSDFEMFRAYPEYQRMVRDRDALRRLQLWAAARPPVLPGAAEVLTNALLKEIGIHIAHLREPAGATPYRSQSGALAANTQIHVVLQWTSLSRLNFTLLGIISRYNDAWDGPAQLEVIASSNPGKLRISHREKIHEVLRILPRDFVPPWIGNLRKLCHLLEIGTDIYVRDLRISDESRGLSDVMFRLTHPHYAELLAELQSRPLLNNEPLAEQASRLLTPVIETYALASVQEAQELL